MARAWEQREPSEARQQATTALLDAAEQLLYEVGYSGVSTRAVAEAAGVKHGLVHYYFSSMEELLTQTLERFVDRLAEALEGLYDDPHLGFADKWRLGAQFWVEEPTSRFPKILMELLAVGWNIPALRARLTNVHGRFRAVFEEHFGRAMREYGLGIFEIGMAISDVFHILGRPQDHGGEMGRTQIEAYDPGRSLQISHCSNIVVLIGIYFKPGLGNNWEWATLLQFEVPFSDRTTISEFQAYLEERSIPWKLGFTFAESDDAALKVGRNVHAIFQKGYLESLQVSGTRHL